MANPIRNPTSGQFAPVAPRGAADSTPPQLPAPGLAAANSASPLPFLTFSPSPSLCQTGGDRAAISEAPGHAGPRPTQPTSQMQDFGQPMGRTQVDGLAGNDPSSSGS